ncbi:unnamed protein product [Rangifer tarandus platyrhynchus]|uniref:Uncharacterized protein n=2 Tax=Rangifer tarandus platyrhynchus TaxID=3082113 RepID=A0ABN8Y6T6_RANTA|nr:unnamed protein product [Rangifer tarandus platyrhynchus]CAI9695151.1 unnamed protein product [Rangifer tarandus platyrhynchus]
MHEFPARNTIEIIVPPGHPSSKPVFPPGPKKWWGPGSFHMDPRPPYCWLGGVKVPSSPCLEQLLTQLSPVTSLPSRAVTPFTRRQTSVICQPGAHSPVGDIRS